MMQTLQGSHNTNTIHQHKYRIEQPFQSKEVLFKNFFTPRIFLGSPVNLYVILRDLFSLDFAMKESHFLGFLLVHQEIDDLTLVAEFPLAVGYFCADIGQIPNLF